MREGTAAELHREDPPETPGENERPTEKKHEELRPSLEQSRGNQFDSSTRKSREHQNLTVKAFLNLISNERCRKIIFSNHQRPGANA